MIQANKINDLYEIFSHLFDYGFYKKYPLFAIEERLIESELVKSLEDDKGDKYLYRHYLTKIFDDVYGIDPSRCEIFGSSSISLWISEAYLRLFYKYHKSFSYLFLLINLRTMYDLYDVYHEMDFDQLFELYENKEKEFKLLNTLIDKKGLSIKQLSILTSISEHTLYNYSKDNESLYNASYENIYKIAHILDVDSKVFVKTLNNYIDYSIYDFDKNDIEYHSYLALYYLEYFYKIDKRGYKFDSSTLSFINNNNVIKVILKKDEIKNINDKEHTQLVLFNDTYVDLLPHQFKDIFVITDSEITRISNRGKINTKYIPSYVYSSLSIKAKNR